MIQSKPKFKIFDFLLFVKPKFPRNWCEKRCAALHFLKRNPTGDIEKIKLHSALTSRALVYPSHSIAMAMAVSSVYSIHCTDIAQNISLRRPVKKLAPSSRIRILSCNIATRNSRTLAISSTRSNIALGNRFFLLPILQRRPRGVELHSVRAGNKKEVERSSVSDFEVRAAPDDVSQLAVLLPLGLASFETLFLVGWVSSLRGLLPFSRALFSAADLILCATMVANCVVGWYALEHSRTKVEELERKVKAARPGWVEMAFSLAVSFIPFGNLFLWFRFANDQRHLSAKARAALVANALVYEGPRLFALVLLFSGGLWVFLQVGLVSNVALVLSALHRPFEEARVKNEKVLVEAARASEKKRQAQKPKEISLEERERIARLQELQEFDMMLAQRSGSGTALLPGEAKEWTVGETMEWLGQQGLARYAPTFAEHNIDGEVLLQLTNDDLRDELKILSFGDRRKLEVLIRQLGER